MFNRDVLGARRSLLMEESKRSIPLKGHTVTELTEEQRKEVDERIRIKREEVSRELRKLGLPEGNALLVCCLCGIETVEYKRVLKKRGWTVEKEIKDGQIISQWKCSLCNNAIRSKHQKKIV